MAGMETVAPMTCPKCGGAMRTYERNGITIDQCTECRGVFLDRGELDRLIDAEEAQNQQPAGDPRGREGGEHGGRSWEGGERGGRRRRGGLLGGLFEGGD